MEKSAAVAHLLHEALSLEKVSGGAATAIQAPAVLRRFLVLNNRTSTSVYPRTQSFQLARIGAMIKEQEAIVHCATPPGALS